MPDVDIQTTDWFPECGELWESSLNLWDQTALLYIKHGQTIPDGVRNVVVSRAAGEAVQVNQENVSLLQLLNSVVEPLHYRCSEDAGELFLLLTDDIKEYLIRTLQ